MVKKVAEECYMAKNNKVFSGKLVVLITILASNDRDLEKNGAKK